MTGEPSGRFSGGPELLLVAYRKGISVALTADDPIVQIADSVADLMADKGYAFVEEEQREDLAIALQSFLQSAGITVNPERARDCYRKVAEWRRLDA